MAGEELRQNPEHVLKDFEGTYIGISPTHESNIGYGEFAVTIDSQGISSRWATGLGIKEDNIDLSSDIQELTGDSAAKLFEDPSEASSWRAFRAGGLNFIFCVEPLEPAAPSVWVTGSVGDLYGPTLLFSPSQVEQGFHEEAFELLETKMGAPGDMPRLNNDGHAPAG